MKNKLFVSNIDFEVDTELLRSIFEEVAPTVSVVIAVDRETKRFKGFAFIEMETEAGATEAISALNEKVINGRPMKVCLDRGKGGQGGDGGRREQSRREYLPPIQRIQLFRRRKKLDPFLEDPRKTVDYRDISFLAQYMSESGRIQPRRHTGLSAYNQRKVAKAIKRAQALGLMSYGR